MNEYEQILATWRTAYDTFCRSCSPQVLKDSLAVLREEAEASRLSAILRVGIKRALRLRGEK